MSDHVRVIVNPRAGGGRAGRLVPAIERAFAARGLEHRVVLTDAAGAATRLAREAIADGVGAIAVAGGDGTLNEVAQAFLDERGERVAHAPDLALVPAGTGGDFRRCFALDNDVDEAVRRLASGKRRPLDLGVLSLTRRDGSRATSAFFNIASFGISGVTDELVNAAPKWMGGRVAFLVGTLRATFAWKNQRVRVRADGEVVHEGPMFCVALANGRWFGGGMQVAPDADTGDGWLDVVVLGDLTRAEAVGLTRTIYTGKHLGHPKVKVRRARVVEAEPLDAEGPVLLDVDGETPGKLPIRATILPGALSLRA